MDKAQAIAGLGGIGKTQTVAEYAYRFRSNYGHVMWLKASSTTSLDADCSRLISLLDLPNTEVAVDSPIQVFKRWLEENSNWLLILDGADDPSLVGEVFPSDIQGHILVTSRDQILDCIGITRVVNLGPLSPDDSVAFLLKRTGREPAIGEAEAAKHVALELGGLPLALEQAAAYIAATQASFHHYRDTLEKSRLRLLEKGVAVSGAYRASVGTTWAVNLEQIEAIERVGETFQSPAPRAGSLMAKCWNLMLKAKNAARKRDREFFSDHDKQGLELVRPTDLLRFSTFLYPDEIPFELITKGASIEWCRIRNARDPVLSLFEAMEPLHHFSLVRINPQRESYSMHTLLQEVVACTMDDESRQKWASRVVKAVVEAFPTVEYDSWPGVPASRKPCTQGLPAREIGWSYQR